MSDMTWLVVGLGNPGPSYAATRHNAGVMVVEVLAGRAGAGFTVHRRSNTDIAHVRVGPAPGIGLVVAKPRSYMNLSGGPVAALMSYFSLSPERLLVIHDELDLPFGVLRLKHGGGDNGHNGLVSVRSSIGTGDYYRLRFGVGRPSGRMEPPSYLVKPFTAVERKDLDLHVERAADAAEAVIVHGLSFAQNHYNG